MLAVPAFGVTNEQAQAALRGELDRLKTRGRHRRGAGPLQGPLQGRPRSAPCATTRRLAKQLAEHQRLFGDWRELFRYIDRLDKVTKADIRRVAGQTFQTNNRTVAMIVDKSQAPAAAPQGGR